VGLGIFINYSKNADHGDNELKKTKEKLWARRSSNVPPHTPSFGPVKLAAPEKARVREFDHNFLVLKNTQEMGFLGPYCTVRGTVLSVPYSFFHLVLLSSAFK
jgi:hypothetical protein